MTCKEAIAVLVEYLEATLDASAAQQMEIQLSACDECRAHLAIYRRTISSVGEAVKVEMPAEQRRGLREFLLERLGRS